MLVVVFCLFKGPTHLTLISLSHTHCSCGPKYLNAILLTYLNTAKKTKSISRYAWNLLFAVVFFFSEPAAFTPSLPFFTVAVADVSVTATHNHTDWCKRALKLKILLQLNLHMCIFKFLQQSDSQFCFQFPCQLVPHGFPFCRSASGTAWFIIHTPLLSHMQI